MGNSTSSESDFLDKILEIFPWLQEGGILDPKQNPNKDLPKKPLSRAASTWISKFRSEEAERMRKYDRLRNLDVIVIDNSIRESTVGQIRGHTVQDKFKIFNETRKCGFKEMIIGAFSHLSRVDDEFIKELIKKVSEEENGRETIAGFWAFSEIADCQISNRRGPDEESIPVGILKMKELGFFNVILEIDIGNAIWDFDSYPIERFLQLLKKRMEWCNENCPWSDKDEENEEEEGGKGSQLLRRLYGKNKPKVRFAVNLRDLPDAMSSNPERVYQTVDFLTKLAPEEFRVFAVLFEDALGETPPEVVGAWVKSIRQLMDVNKSKAHLGLHVHERYGFADAAVVQALTDGADGIWCSVAAEGGSVGHASSCLTLINLIRLGNEKVIDRYNCQNLRKAAIAVTLATTGSDPPKRQPVFGPRAIDTVFDSKMGGKEKFSMAEFFGETSPVRLTTMCNEKMILEHLKTTFGEDPDAEFTSEVATKMRENILDDLKQGKKEEYMSAIGLAMLFERSGGDITPYMRDLITDLPIDSALGKLLIQEARVRWDDLDAREDDVQDEMLTFDSFYNGFMAPFFSCYRCADTIKGLQCLDMDDDGQVDWAEFKLYLQWALNEYPAEIETLEDMLDVAFRKGLIPSMRAEKERRDACQLDAEEAESTEGLGEEKEEDKGEEEQRAEDLRRQMEERLGITEEMLEREKGEEEKEEEEKGDEEKGEEEKEEEEKGEEEQCAEDLRRQKEESLGITEEMLEKEKGEEEKGEEEKGKEEKEKEDLRRQMKERLGITKEMLTS